MSLAVKTPHLNAAGVPQPTPKPKRASRARTVGGNGASRVGACCCGARWAGLCMAHCGGCHRTFGGVTLFDQHRSVEGEHGACLDPAQLRGKDGQQLAYYRDGVWHGPPMPAEELARRLGLKGG